MTGDQGLTQRGGGDSGISSSMDSEITTFPYPAVLDFSVVLVNQNL